MCQVVLVMLGVLVCSATPNASAPSGGDRSSGSDGLHLIYDGTAYYPRAVELTDGTVLATFDHPISGGKALGCVRSRNGGKTWGEYIRITEDKGHVDLANAFPLQLADGTILVACRHHRLDDKVFAIEIHASTDSGKTWQSQSRAASGSKGLWEPFLFQPSRGVVQAYYASEEGIRPDQRIEMKASRDGGRSWGQPVTVARKPGSRDGMPAVVRARNGDLLACFEASDAAPFGFVIRVVRSKDYGASWSAERGLVYQPTNPARARWSAGAPYMISLPDGRLMVSLQTDEDVVFAKGDVQRDPALTEYRYTRHTVLKAVVSRDDGRSWGRPVRLSGSPSEPATWGGLCVMSGGRVLELVGVQGRVWCRIVEP